MIYQNIIFIKMETFQIAHKLTGSRTVKHAN